MFEHDKFHILQDHIAVMVTMVFGSFVAGSSPEGSASISYPVYTLYLGISPDVARNFAFAIQSLGMTGASVYILNKKIPLDWNYIIYVTIGGLIGLVLGTFYLIPYIQPVYAKLIFVSLWLSFGIILFLENRKKHRIILDKIVDFRNTDIANLLLFGLIGGGISSLFGTGINIFTFCFLVIYYKVNEKVATPSSIVIMTIETIAGFALHALIMKDIIQQTYDMWLSCIPIVIFFAPLGAFLVHKISRVSFTNFLYFIFLLQYIGAMFVIRPDLIKSALSIGIILFGLVFFRYISSLKRYPSEG
ncbi:MAG: sulfite exporter TauE/SafE family protein [Saprospiraceae bacterium]|nr:sulfite exporter TauE/SafE family protein [Saprospiraceae bacterium]